MSWAPSRETALTLRQLGVDVDQAKQLFVKTSSEPSDHTFKAFAVSRTYRAKDVSISLNWRPSKSTRQRFQQLGYPLSVVEDLLPLFLLSVREGQPVTDLDRSFERYVEKRYVLPKRSDPLLTNSVEQHLVNRGFSRAALRILANQYDGAENDHKTHCNFIEYALTFNPALTDSLIS